MQGTDRRTFLRRAAVTAAAFAVPGTWELLRPPGALGAGGALRALDAATRGPLYVPGSKEYANARPGFNLAYDARRPRAILQPLDAADVAAAIRWADSHNVSIAARSGGHSYAGYSTPHNGLLVDLRRMRGVGMSGGQLRVGAGAQMIDVHAFLTPRGLMLPSGSCPSVGVGGLTLGGGMGLSGRAFGLTCDRLRAVEIVTADGTPRRVDATSEPDLFWALRGGGGGNFGIATAFEFAPAAASSAAWFMMRWPWSQADEVLAAWLDFAPGTDRRLTSLCTLMAGGTMAVTALGQFYGSESQLRTLIAPLRRVPGASLHTGTSGTMSLVRRWAGCLDKSVVACHTAGTRPGGTLGRERFAAASGYLRRAPTPAGVRRLTRLAELRHAQGMGGALIFDAYGGAINDVAADATAFVHRAELASVQAYAGYGPGGRARTNAWLAAVRSTLAAVGSGAAYQNYIDPNLTGWARAYYGANLDRLRQVRRRYDPGGVLGFAQAIPL